MDCIKKLLVFLLLKNEILAQFDIAMNAFDVMNPNDTEFMDMNNLKLKRLDRNQPHVILGELILHKDADNRIDIRCDLYKKQGQEFRKSAYSLKGKFCELFKNDKTFLPQSLAYTDIPQPFPCPLPAKTYHMNGLYLNFTGLPPVLATGDYQIRFYFIENGKDLNGFISEINVVNKMGTMYRPR